MHLQRPVRLLAAIASLALAGCHRQCGIVSSTIASATILDPSGAAVASTSFLLREEVGPISYYIAGGVRTLDDVPRSGLWGHVTRARLVSESGEVLLTMDTNVATLGGVVSAIVSKPLSAQEFARLRDALLTTRSRLLLETDLPGRESLDTRLSDARYTPSDPPPCPSL